MAYLNTQLSKQDLVVVDKATVSVESSIQSDTGTENYVENSNFHIASKLKIEKSKLINALSQFPMTALWLLNQYEQRTDIVEQDEDLTVEAELTTDLKEIKKYFYSLSVKSVTDNSYAAEKQDLTTALQLFAFTFNDLVGLVDMFVFAYKFRGLCYQSGSQSNKKESDLMLKRLEGDARRSKNKASVWSEIFLSYDEQFLFLSSSDMPKYFTEIVFSENNWLKLRQQLATANSRLVLFIANQYKGGFLDFDDLVQEGQTGLLKAVDRYDYRLGFQFSTYAGYWIRQAISRSLSRCERVVRVPCGQVANMNKVFRVKDQFIAKKGREPSLKELAEQVKLSPEEITSIFAISQTAISLEGTEEEGEVLFSPIDYLEQEVFVDSFKKISKMDLDSLIGKAIKGLNPREAKVISCHFGVEVENSMTLQEIGVELNLTRERVRQIQVMALNKIRRSFGDQLVAFL